MKLFDKARDLKPENFIFETSDANSEIKLIDFGLSKCFYDYKGKFPLLTTQDKKFKTMLTFCGTIYYFASEIVL